MDVHRQSILKWDTDLRGFTLLNVASQCPSGISQGGHGLFTTEDMRG
ncbi:MAG: hypothetical protein JRI53_05970 [Deltaproteobacteria bacterium]|nr:hypothetical protein [Deltaproteobacteria bacterium]